MMKATEIRDAHKAVDYNRFKETFPTTTGEDKVANLVKVVSSIVNSIASELGSQDVYDVQIKATELAEHVLRVLKASDWFADRNMTDDNFDFFLVSVLHGIPAYQR